MDGKSLPRTDSGPPKRARGVRMKRAVRFLCIVFAAGLALGNIQPGSRVYAFTEEEEAHIGEARAALQVLLQDRKSVV